MEDQNNRISEITGEANDSEASEKPSTSSANIKCEGNSSQNSKSISMLEDSSQAVDVVELSSDDELQIVEVSETKSVKKLLGNKSSLSTSGRTSPKDVTCSVCLSEYENKSFLDKCFHSFCYFCILQWSEIVRTCPLCKSSFTSIIHSVKSMDNYQQHYLSKPEINAPEIQHQSQGDGRRFRYRTTLADGGQYHHETQRRQQEVNDAWGQRTQRRQAYLSLRRNRGVMARERRRTIYSSNLWVQGVTQTGRPRQREISAAFFRANPACCHRLIPWLTRDLKVLLNEEESHVNFLLQIILSLITKVELTSEDFCNHLRPFLFDKTEHFIHEFISFSRSPFDVTAYDERAQYSWPDESRDQVGDTPIVFNSHFADWQTPIPGPSGVSLFDLSETDWNRDSPVLQIGATSWSPNSSPGLAGLNEPITMGAVTISSNTSSQTVSVEHLSDEHSTGSSSFTIEKKRRGSFMEAISEEETRAKSRKGHGKHKHKHRHKHKRKHNGRDSTGHNVCRRSKSSERNSDMPGPSGCTSVDPWTSENPVDVIVISDDTASLDVFEDRSRSERIDFSSNRGRRQRTLSSSRSRSRSVSKGKRSLQFNYRRRSRSKCRDERKPNRRRKSSPSRHSQREYSSSKKTANGHCRTSPRESSSHSRGRSKERSKCRTRSRSRSRHSSKERYRSKRNRHFQDDHQDSFNEQSKKSGFKITKNEREMHRSSSRASNQSQSRSRGKSALDTRTTDSRKWTKSSRDPCSRSTSPLPRRHESASSSYSRNSRSRSPTGDSRSRSRFRLSRSPSRNHTNHTNSSGDLRSRSRNPSESKAYSASESNESTDKSNDDIRKEIEDLELRITADKKRLLKLLIKQDRTKRDSVSATSEETEGIPREDL